jgi:hypothetical protein
VRRGQAALLSEEQVAGEPEHVRELLGRIRPALLDIPLIQ